MRDAKGRGQSTRSLMWFSLILLGGQWVVLDPVLGVALTIPTALCALAPIVGGPQWPRLLGIGVLVLSLALAVTRFPEARKQMDAYRARSAASDAPTPTPPARNR
jgi:hypothetical protein